MITVQVIDPSEPLGICVLDDDKPLVYLKGPMSFHAAGAFIMSLKNEDVTRPSCIALAMRHLKPEDK